MTLELRTVLPHRVVAGASTELRDGLLTVGSEQLATVLRREDPRIRDVLVHVLAPGESTRVLCVKDVIEPRCKEGDAVHAVGGVAVVTCGPIVGFQEGIIDMSGPGAEHSPFSSLHLIVIEIDVGEDLAPHEHEEVVRLAGLRAAGDIARRTAGVAPDRVEKRSLGRVPDGARLPRIAYVYLVLSQGLLHDTWIDGRNARDGFLPIALRGDEIGRVELVSGNCVSACDKNTTWHHQNNPIIRELARGHGQRWNLVGVVLSDEPVRLEAKERSAHGAVELVERLGAEAAIISKEGFGNPDADLMMIVRGLEHRGIRTVAITDEFAGRDGASQSLADSTPEADAIVSAGNANEPITLGPMTKTIGPAEGVPSLAGAGAIELRPDHDFEVELQVIIGATNQLGHGRSSCREV